jgi:hypothetical protein
MDSTTTNDYFSHSRVLISLSIHKLVSHHSPAASVPLPFPLLAWLNRSFASSNQNQNSQEANSKNRKRSREKLAGKSRSASR